MKSRFRFTIARKLTLGFGVLMIAVLSTSYYTYITLDENIKTNSLITDIYTPSASLLNDLLFMITNTKVLIQHWAREPKEGTQGKKQLKQVHAKDYPELKRKLAPLVEEWGQEERETYQEITRSIDELFQEHRLIMEQLSSFEDYDNVLNIFTVNPKVEENGEVMILTDSIVAKLDTLVERQRQIVEKSNAQMDRSFARFQRLIFWMGVILFISIMAIAILTTRALVRPILYIKGIIQRMGKGVLPDEKIKGGSDEIGEMAEALNELVKGLRKTSEFSLEIGEGNFSSEFHPLSEQDVLGNSLVIMRENLKKASEAAELRKVENNQRTWASQGVAMFSELLRKSSDNMEEFSYTIISKLVKYLEASQGALFIINDNDKNDVFIELSAAYAYERRKYLEKRIEIGVTVIGQCVQEKETIYMTDIPENYINITSGLGEDNPTSLLVVPLITNEEVFGVVEIASFNEFEPYQIEFVEKLGENIASSILSVKISNNTSRLLSESQEKSERLARQEEEMRQRISQLQAEQEEQLKKDQEKYNLLKQEYEEKIIKLQSKIEELQKKLNEQRGSKFKYSMSDLN